MDEVIDETNLHLEVQKRCHRVPLYDTIEELKNPTGILAEEYSRIMKQLKENKQYENRNCSK
jgi:hypothetical protein